MLSASLLSVLSLDIFPEKSAAAALLFNFFLVFTRERSVAALTAVTWISTKMRKQQVKVTLHCFDRRLSLIFARVFFARLLAIGLPFEISPRREIALICPSLRWIGADEHADWPLLLRLIPPFRHRLRAVIHRD